MLSRCDGHKRNRGPDLRGQRTEVNLREGDEGYQALEFGVHGPKRRYFYTVPAFTTTLFGKTWQNFSRNQIQLQVSDSNRLVCLGPSHLFAVDTGTGCRYTFVIITPVASVAGREAGSLESASAFSGDAA
jgi:hypothetical protein